MYGINKFGNKTQVEFRSHFWGKKGHLMGQGTRYIAFLLRCTVSLHPQCMTAWAFRWDLFLLSCSYWLWN